MTKPSKADLKKRVIIAAREYGIRSVLFRNLVGEKLGLNVTDMECLGLLFHKKLSSPSELARQTGLTSGATTAMLDRLERSDLIERKPNPHDRRGTLIALRRTGSQRVDPWFASARKAQENLISDYSEQELELLAEYFEKSAKMWDEERQKLQEAHPEK